MRIVLLLFGILAFATILSAQAPSGPVFDNYGTFPAAFQQPAAGLRSPYHWEIQLGGQANFENNYLFIQSAAGFWLLNQVRNANVLGVVNGSQTWIVGSRVYNFDYFNDEATRFARMEASVTGPSISFRFGDNWRVGLFHRVRAAGDARDIDNKLSYDPYELLPEGGQIVVGPASARGAAWQEVGLNIAKSFPSDFGEWGIGINARYINPLSAASLITTGNTTLTKVNRGSINLENADIQLGLSGDLLTNNPGFAAGYGWGIDIGLTYSFGFAGTGSSSKPQWTIGASLLDLGAINFTDNAEVHRFQSIPELNIEGDDYEFAGEGLEQLPQVLAQFNQDFYPGAATNTSLVGSGFQIGLPTRAMLSVSYQATDEWGFDGRILAGMPTGENSLRAGQVASINMRYTKWWYGAGASLHLHEFNQPNLGLYVRLGPFYFGSDRVIDTFITRNQLAAGDFYAGLRIHAFKEKTLRGAKRSRSKYNECYQF